jgi:hypothetical protein
VNVTLIAWCLICAAGLALSARSAVVLRRGSPWSLAGWLASAAYFALALAVVARPLTVLRFGEVAVLVVVVGGFVVAGVRDERQAEPWWWPEHPGMTGRERRAARRG